MKVKCQASKHSNHMKSQLQSISIYTESDDQRKIKLSTEKGKFTIDLGEL